MILVVPENLRPFLQRQGQKRGPLPQMLNPTEDPNQNPGQGREGCGYTVGGLALCGSLDVSYSPIPERVGTSRDPAANRARPAYPSGD